MGMWSSYELFVSTCCWGNLFKHHTSIFKWKQIKNKENLGKVKIVNLKTENIFKSASTYYIDKLQYVQIEACS